MRASSLMMRASLNFCSKGHRCLSLIFQGTGNECTFYLASLSITNLCCSSICKTTEALQIQLYIVLSDYLKTKLQHAMLLLCQIKLWGSKPATRWTHLYQKDQNGSTFMEWKRIYSYPQMFSANEKVSTNAALLLLICQLQQSAFLLSGNYPVFKLLCSKRILFYLGHSIYWKRRKQMLVHPD